MRQRSILYMYAENGQISRDLSLTNQSREFMNFIGLYIIVDYISRLADPARWSDVEGRKECVVLGSVSSNLGVDRFRRRSLI